MNAPLYSRDILRLAAETVRTPRLATPHATVEARSRTCGSTVVVDVAVDGAGRVTHYGHEVHACALGQAAAALLAQSVIGHDAGGIAAARDALARYLEDSDAGAPAWPGTELLACARPYRARHPSIRLAFEAAADAVAQAAARPR